MLLNVLGCRLTYEAQAETNAEAWFNIALRPRKPESSLGQTAQDGHLDSHTAPEQRQNSRCNIYPQHPHCWLLWIFTKIEADTAMNFNENRGRHCYEYEISRKLSKKLLSIFTKTEDLIAMHFWRKSRKTLLWIFTKIEEDVAMYFRENRGRVWQYFEYPQRIKSRVHHVQGCFRCWEAIQSIQCTSPCREIT